MASSPALPSADLSLRRRQPRRRVKLLQVESLFTNGWHFSFRQASFLQTVAAENLLLEGSFAFPSSEATSFNIRFRVLFAIKLAVVSPIRGPGDEHAIAIAQCTATPNNRISTNKQNNLRSNTSKKHDLSCYCPKLVCCCYCLWWDFNLWDHSSPMVLFKVGVSDQF